MKKRNLFFLLPLLVLMALPVYADTLESVRVIKFWDDTDDVVVERASGERLLIQHNRVCSTMSTEFPMQILWSNGKITQAKVASNELCDVYNFGPYSSEVLITERIASSNALSPEHLAELEWKGARYRIDYGDGCRNLKDFVDHIAYVYTPNEGLDGAALYLPKDRGQCEIKSAEFIQQSIQDSSVADSPIQNLRLKAENNQAFFSWDAFEEDENWLVLVAHSKYQLNPDEYTLSQLPNLKRTKLGSIRILQLVNDQPYYFYITASNAEGELAPWIEVPVTPIQTRKRVINQPDPEAFEIEMTETDDAFVLAWPDKAEASRKYMIMVFVDGKRQIFELIDGAVPEYRLEKKPEWESSRFRMTVRSLPFRPFGVRFFDSIFWRKG